MALISVGYFSLLIVTFLSATILPFSSELLFAGMLSNGYSILYCIVIATLGNSLGGITNFFVGKIGNPQWFKKLNVKENTIQKQQYFIQKYGYWLAFLSWIPIIGDPLMVALGFYRVPFLPFMTLLIIGKLTRYLAIAWWFI